MTMKSPPSQEAPASTSALPKPEAPDASRRKNRAPLLDRIRAGKLILQPEHRRERSFCRCLKRMVKDPSFRDSVHRLRDAVLRSALNEKRSTGLVVALTGVRGGEGVTPVSLALALSLGAVRDYRVAFLDGRFNENRFTALSEYLDLAGNSARVEKGSLKLTGNYNESQPNVLFLRNLRCKDSLEFFADKRLKSVLTALRENFDFTVIDLPPQLSESSHVFVCPEVDRVYLVVSAGKTRLLDVDRCAEAFSEAGVEISGVVVNRQKTPLWSRLLWKEYFF